MAKAAAQHSHHHHHAHPSRRGFLRLLIPGSILATRAFAQQQAGDQAARFRDVSLNFERTGLAEPFKGITASGEIAPGLFPIQSTGVSTEPVRQAAEHFLVLAHRGAARADDLPDRRRRSGASG